MVRILALLLCYPAIATAADWAPRPGMFTYDATFATCTFDPSAPDLAATCAQTLIAAYALKHAVAMAAMRCGRESLTTCAAPFEDEGLPAIAAQIAVTAGCDETDLRDFDPAAPLPADHCVTMIADIMNDEGVVPLYSDLSGRFDKDDLARIHAALWSDAITEMTDSTLTQQRKQAAIDTCSSTANNHPDCLAHEFAQIWADLTLQIMQEN